MGSAPTCSATSPYERVWAKGIVVSAFQTESWNGEPLRSSGRSKACYVPSK
jgi:hypothetical protein